MKSSSDLAPSWSWFRISGLADSNTLGSFLFAFGRRPVFVLCWAS